MALRILVCGFLALLAAVVPLPGARAVAGDIVLRDMRVSPPAETVLSASRIAALPDARIVTRTEFTDGVITFLGPLAKDVFALAGAAGWQTARMIAANDYSIDIPASDFAQYGVIFAHTADGRRLSLRDKGPYWVMYPLDDHPELKDPTYNNRLIWQLVAIEVR